MIEWFWVVFYLVLLIALFRHNNKKEYFTDFGYNIILTIVVVMVIDSLYTAITTMT
jgi:hypothetical protein